MIEAPTVALAFAAGLISFLSPCCLPLVPGYLAVISRNGGTGAPTANVAIAPSRVDPSVIGRSLLFVLSFSAVFIVLGLSATALGSLLVTNQIMLRQLAAIVIVGMGVFFIASAFMVRLNRDFRPSGLLERAGRGGPVLVGLAFAIAWTPCVGPALGAILGLASTQQSLAEGAGLLAVYSMGLGLPFIACAFGVTEIQRRLSVIQRHFKSVQILAGLILVAMGALIYTNQLFLLNIEAQRFLDGLGLNFFQSV